MIFKQNCVRFLAKDNLVFLGCCAADMLLFALVGYYSVCLMYIWAVMIYSSLILLGPEDISKICCDKKKICFALCLAGGAILEIMKR